MAWTYTNVEPTLLENTTMVLCTFNGVDKLYRISPNEGYLLHDSRADDYEYDDEGNVVGEPILRYKRTMSSCTIAQFNANTYNIYAVPEDSVPADSILNEDGNVEVMSE